LGARARLPRAGGAQVIDAHVDRLRHPLAVGLLEKLEERGQLEERAHYAAVDRRERGVADDVVAERQDGHQSCLVGLDAHAQERGIGDVRERGRRLHSPPRPSRMARATGLSAGLAPTMNVARQLANGSSGLRSHAVARTKATWLVTL